MEGDGDFLSGILLDGEGSHEACCDDLGIPNSQETHDEVQATRSSKGTRRSKNFHWKEDEVVCLAWLKVSKDHIHGANQKRNTFWGKVHAFYEQHKDPIHGVDRSESLVMHRWLTIQFQVNKFCLCYEAIKHRNQSGTTIEDKMNEAKKLYTSLDKDNKSFGLDHCWTILKGEDKWKAKMIELAELEKQERSKKKKAAKKSWPRDEGGNEPDVAADVEVVEVEPRKRSDGIKKVKENYRRGCSEAAVQAFDKMWAKKEESDKEKEKAKQERFMASIEVDKEALELEKKRADAELKRAEADLLKQEKEIMMANKVCLDTLQLEWLEMMQKEICAKRLGKSV